jgi:DNA repair protein REV1
LGRYKQFSLKFYTILMAHADDVQAVSVDEALIEATSAVARYATAHPACADPAKEFAEVLRGMVRDVTGCEGTTEYIHVLSVLTSRTIFLVAFPVSIGIGHNILLARLATRRAKPAKSYHLLPSEVSSFISPLDIKDLHGFGSSARSKVQEKFGVTTLGELMGRSKGELCGVLGKSVGETLWNAMRGVDERKLESDKPRRSVSCDITVCQASSSDECSVSLGGIFHLLKYGIRFDNDEQAQAFIYQMAEEVARRLDSIGMHGRSLTLKVMKRDPSAPVEAPKVRIPFLPSQSVTHSAPVSGARSMRDIQPASISRAGHERRDEYR